MAEKKDKAPAAERPAANDGQVLTVTASPHATWQTAEAQADAPQAQPRRLDEAEQPGGKYRVNGRFVNADGDEVK